MRRKRRTDEKKSRRSKVRKIKKLAKGTLLLPARLKKLIAWTLLTAILCSISEVFVITRTAVLLDGLLGVNDQTAQLSEKVSTVSWDGILLFCGVLSSMLLKLANLFVVGKTASGIGVWISERLFINLTTNPRLVGNIERTEYMSSVNEQASDLTWNCIRPLICTINDSIIATGIICAVMQGAAREFLTVAISVGMTYGVFILCGRKLQKRLSSRVNNRQMEICSETSNSINNLFLLASSKETGYQFKTLFNLMKELRDAQFKAQFLTIYPRYVIEGMGLGALVSIAYLSAQANIFVSLGVVAVAAQRILPNIQQIYSSFVSITNNQDMIERISTRLLTSKETVNTQVLGSQNKVVGDNVVIEKGGKKILHLKGNHILCETGKVTIVNGPSGSGKTTLLRVIIGLEKISEGSIQCNGIEISTSSHTSLRYTSFGAAVGYVSQESFAIRGNIYENVALGDFDGNEDSRNRINELLKEVGLYDELERNSLLTETISDDMKTLSGGQLKRLCIARALWKIPKIIIMDEPTGGLDIKNKGIIADVVKEYSNSSAIIVTSHDEEFIEMLGDAKKTYLSW